MNYVPSRTYRDVLWLRQNYLPAKLYWDNVRSVVKERENNKCQFCSERGTEIHHVKYKGVLFHEHLYVGDREILQLVCRRCHQGIEDAKKRAKKKRGWFGMGQSGSRYFR